MDHLSITNLEAELAYLEDDSPITPPRSGHGDRTQIFEIPRESSPRLDPPSKTESMYSFGNNGTLAWTTPGGELLQVANCIDNRLISADYKRSIERGRDYHSRGKVLEQALGSRQGSGFGIGLSLGVCLDPVERSWLFNRWPRFAFQHNGLEIILQYFIDSQSIVQEYHIRNAGREEISLPYLVSSDVCFREHRGQSSPIQPVPTGKSAQRMLLFQNTEVLVRNDIEMCQLKMALFFNAKKQCLWTTNGLEKDLEKKSVRKSSVYSSAEVNLEDADESLRSRILTGQLVDEDADSDLRKLYRRWYDRADATRQSLSPGLANLATHKGNLIVPPGSTQELRLVIQLLGLQHAESGLLEPQSKPPKPAPKLEDSDRQRNTDAGERIRSRQKMLIVNTKQIRSKISGLDDKRRLTKIIHDHIDLGLACENIESVAEARYHLLMACLIAEYLYREGSYALSNARFIYAKFLHKHGWPSKALDILEKLSTMLSKARSTTKEFTVLREKVQIRLANMYLDETGTVSEAERIYQSALSSSVARETLLKAVPAFCLERIAWAQVKQNKYEDAHASYSRLLRLLDTRHQIIFINLGFIERKFGRYVEAARLYEKALEANGSGHAIERFYAQSGLYACLRKLGTSPADHPELRLSLTDCPDVGSLLKRSCCPLLYCRASVPGFPLQFTLSRHIESLLSTCSIPVSSIQGISGIAFVDTDPLQCGNNGRFAYFQFKLLTQFQKYLDNIPQEEESLYDNSKRIKATCQGHLVWVFKIAGFNDTWGRDIYYSLRGDTFDDETSAAECSTSQAVEGASNFSKLWLYLSTWDTEWEFILDLLHSRLIDWLVYLARSRHMDHLWVETHGYEALRPYDTISPGFGGILYNWFPEYQLSDFTMLWLAFRQIEHLIASLGSNAYLEAKEDDDPIKHKFNEIRQAFEDCQKTLGSRTIRTNILKTFVVSLPDGPANQASAGEKTINNLEANGLNAARTMVPVDVSPTGNDLDSFRNLRPRKAARQILAYRRTINEYDYVIQPTDIATIEAAIAGFFEDSDEQIFRAWQESLKLQQDQFISSFEVPVQVALTLFAAKFGYTLGNTQIADIEKECLARLAVALYDSGAFAQTTVGNAPEPMRSWSALTYETLSILVGGLFPECRFTLPSHKTGKDGGSVQDAAAIVDTLQEIQTNMYKRGAPIEMPQHLATSSKPARRNVVDDSKFLPAWMYHHPTYLHEQPLKFDFEQAFKSIDGFIGLKTAVDKWKTSKGFSKSREPVIFLPHVADSGTKTHAGKDADLVQRRMDVEWYGTAADIYDRLMQPRTFDHAKKRLVELPSHNQETALICWLTAPEQEKPMFLEFLRRHGSSESFFGERVDWKGNIWETELHLGFYQLIPEEKNKCFRPPHLDYHGQLRTRKMPSLSQDPSIIEITPCSISLRFVGDLRDRSWTCHFLSSAARDDGFTGILDEFTDAGILETRLDSLYRVKIGQRKVLEMTYVERVLAEMAQSCEGILAGLRRELDVPETEDPQSESYEFIDSYSRLHSKAGEILRDVFRQLEVTVRTLEDWEKREDNRDLQSRWSEKDETRHGERLRDLGRKCKIGTQLLRRYKDRLEEYQKLAERRHSSLVNYMSLRTARTSSQSAEDVRLFTYVTIIFLPLSFSSSLFSMQGAPATNVVSVMVPTTAIALALTIFVLANMKSLDRNFNFLVYKINASARRKMQLSKQSWGFSWNRISGELEESVQLQLKPENDNHLPAQSKWYYFLFWISYALKLPRLYVLESFHTGANRKNTPVNSLDFLFRILLSVMLAPACIFIFAAELVIVTTNDIVRLLWKACSRLKRTLLHTPRGEKGAKKGFKKLLKRSGLDQDDGAKVNAIDEEQDAVNRRRRLSELSVETPKDPGKFVGTCLVLSRWLQTPPRPIQEFIEKKLDLAKDETNELEPPIAESELEDGPLVSNDRMPDFEDEWAMAMDEGPAGKDKVVMSRSLSGLPLQRQPSDESYKQNPSVWGRWNTKIKDWQKPESKV